MTENFVTQREHDDLSGRVNRLEQRIDKVEMDQNTRDATMHKALTDLSREQSEKHLELIKMMHSVENEVAADRLATSNIEKTLKTEIANNNLAQADQKSKTVRWMIGLFVMLLAGSGAGVLVEIAVRELLTGHP